MYLKMKASNKDALEADVLNSIRSEAPQFYDKNGVLLDPWGSRIMITNFSDPEKVTFRSIGPDKIPGTGDDIVIMGKDHIPAVRE
jgi:hypothetical protein